MEIPRKLNPEDAARHELFEANKDRLAQIAGRTIARGMSPRDFALVVIDVDDPLFTELVDILMPNENWQAIRDRGERPLTLRS